MTPIPTEYPDAHKVPLRAPIKPPNTPRKPSGHAVKGAWGVWGGVPAPPPLTRRRPSHNCRAEEVAVRHLLAVRADPGHPGVPQPEDEGAGLRHLQGDGQRHQRAALHAGLPLLRQAHGETPKRGFFTLKWGFSAMQGFPFYDKPMVRPQNGAFLTQNGGSCPEMGAFLPQNGAFLPQNGAFLPQNEAFRPQNGAFLPQNGGSCPEMGAFLPPNGAFLPQNGAFLPCRASLSMTSPW